MAEQQSLYSWEKQKRADSCQVTECPDYDCYKDFKRDPCGYYVLVKVNFALLRIEVGVCDKDHNVVQIFRGKKSQDIYQAIFKYEKDHRIVWFEEKTHIAYLGKELKKAELALAMGNAAYFQE